MILRCLFLKLNWLLLPAAILGLGTLTQVAGYGIETTTLDDLKRLS